jgi:hypothetical protein
MKNFEEEIRNLPPELKQEVADFVEFLLKKRKRKSGGMMGQPWAGALRDFRGQYTSLDLQKKIMEWRGN